MDNRIDAPEPCSICGDQRTRHDAVKGPTCASPECMAAVLTKANRALKRKCDAFAESAADERGLSEPIAAQVPYFDCAIVKTPEERKRAFRRNLRNELRKTCEDAAKGSLAPINPYDDEPSSPVLDVSCITCRGYCCRLGAGHAFLDRANLPSILNRRPADSPASIYRDYVERIPDEATENSCIYQGAKGCVLPRDMRSDLANGFECNERIAFKKALGESEGEPAVVIAAHDGKIRSAAIAERDKPFDWLPVPEQD